MTKTLADMTAEERADCVGMWCEVGDGLEILAEPDGMVDYHDTAIMHSVKRNGGSYVLANAITPRFDLPRAWTPDGEPVDGAWEKSTAELPTKDYKSTFTQHYRRWVGDWEQDNE